MGSFISWFERSYKGIIVALVAIMAAALVVLAIQHVDASKPAVGAEPRTPPTYGISTPETTPGRVKISAGTKVLIFGDSWTSGFFADEPETNGYAYRTAKTLQWDATISGGPGTGYTNDGPDGEGTFADRAAALPDDLTPELIVLQGSVNDLGAKPGDLRAAVLDTINTMSTKYSTASIVVVGPAATESPASDGIRSIDRTLRSVTVQQNLNYISPLQEEWFNRTNIGDVIDAAKAKHPTTSGHALLAEQLVADLSKIGS